MKFSQLVLLFCLTFGLTLISCKDEATESKNETPESVSPTANPAGNTGIMNATTEGQTANTATGAAGGELHYKCTTAGCTGGGSAQGNCPVCGAELVHNAAFHTQNQGNQANPAGTQTTPVMIDPATGQPTQAQQITPPPAQNASGEYHYTCAAGHPGAGAAGNCSTCGAALSHNAAYHN